MKKVTYLLLLAMFSVKSYGQVLETNCIVESDFNILNYMQVQLHSLNYSSLHSASRAKHTKAYYFNSKVFEFLDSFINSTKQVYFGFNVYFLSYRKNAARYQSNTAQSLLHIVPVYDNPANPKTDTTPDYSALNVFFNSLQPGYFTKDLLNKGVACPGKCDSSVMAWTYDNNYNRLNELPGVSTGQDIFTLATAKTTHSGNRTNYLADHKTPELGGKQTEWVYFNADKIKLIAEFLRKSSITNFPIVAFYFGSYNSLVRAEQAHKDQTTLTLAPLRRMRNGFYEPDICSFVEYCNVQTKNKVSLLHISVNHGELCPTDCPPEGF